MFADSVGVEVDLLLSYSPSGFNTEETVFIVDNEDNSLSADAGGVDAEVVVVVVAVAVVVELGGWGWPIDISVLSPL